MYGTPVMSNTENVHGHYNYPKTHFISTFWYIFLNGNKALCRFVSLRWPLFLTLKEYPKMGRGAGSVL